MGSQRPIRIVHVLFHFGIGGLENGLVNLINRLDEDAYQHFVVCLTDFDETYASRVTGHNFELRALNKGAGHDPAVWSRMWRALREIKPDILHTRNFVALEMQVLGLAARVRGRVHGEHGWDVQDLDGAVRKYQIARRVIGHAVHRFIALSGDLERYLLETVGTPPHKVVQIYNGVDCERFHPAPRPVTRTSVIGTVGRMKSVKNQTLLCRAFVALAVRRPDLATAMRLRIVGSGPLRAACESIMDAAGMRAQVEFRGDSDTVADEMRSMDVFVLPSLAEGISNTILEAMASGLPVIATRVGGNPELIAQGRSGFLVAADNDIELSAALERYLDTPGLRQEHGAYGRELVLERFNLERMVRSYDQIYRGLVA